MTGFLGEAKRCLLVNSAATFEKSCLKKCFGFSLIQLDLIGRQEGGVAFLFLQTVKR